MATIDKYFDLIDEIAALAHHPHKIPHQHLDDYVRELQCRVQTFNVDDAVRELIEKCSFDRQKAIDYIKSETVFHEQITPSDFEACLSWANANASPIIAVRIESIFEAMSFCSKNLLHRIEAPKPMENGNARKIDEEAIGNWFNAQFKGAGNGNINHLPYLISDLKQNRSNKEFAKIAFLIYNSRCCLCGKKPFSTFYQDFCLAVGCQQKKYDPCKLKDKEFAKKFYYL